MSKKILISALTSLSFATTSLATTQYVAPAPPPPPPQNVTTSSGQIYDASVKGLRKYVDSLKDENPHLYGKLDPDIRNFESQQSNAYIGMGVSGGVMLAGLGLTLYPLISGNISEKSLGLVYAGTGVTILGVLGFACSSWIFAPSREDFLDFMNKHNRLNPNNKLDLKMGFVPTLGGGSLAASLRF
jgi:hypothetical protein